MRVKNYLHSMFTLGVLSSFSAATYAQNCTPPAAGCSNVDISNAYLNSTDPNTIEYDNIVSTYHSTIARESDGVIYLWGEGIANDGVSDVLAPQELNSTNYPGLTGDILKFTGGSWGITRRQFAVLTTTGLYVWGVAGDLISTTIKSTDAFASITVDGNSNGLPPGVSPQDVKMLFGSYHTLAIATCNGDVWVLSAILPNLYGDGTASIDHKWHRVKKSAAANDFLTNIVAVRGNSEAMVALDNAGQLWTWGNRCYNGAGTVNNAAISYATQMTIPVGVTPKMIAVSVQNGTFNWGRTNVRSSYYLLATDGRLFSLGNNEVRQLGDFTTTNRNTWVQVQKSATAGDYLTDVAWISTPEHDGGWTQPYINVITDSGSLYAWGYNDSYTIGFSTNAAYDPTPMPGNLAASDRIAAVESGGHTSIVVKNCTGRYGYVGHKIYGSMGDGIGGGGYVTDYNFTATATLDLCAASAVAEILTPDSSIVMPGVPFTVLANIASGTFSVLSGNATIDTAGVVTATAAGNIVVVFSSGNIECPTSDTVVLKQGGMVSINDFNQTPQDVPVNGDVLTNDFGAGAITVTGATQGSTTIVLGTPTTVSGIDSGGNPVANAGTLILNTDGSYIYTPASGFVGTVDSVPYNAVDAFGNTDDAVLIITVIPNMVTGSNNPPIAEDDNVKTQVNTSITSTVIPNDSDPDGDTITVTGAVQGSTTLTVSTPTTVSGLDEEGNPVTNAGTLTLHPDGSYTYTPAVDFTGTVDPVTYTISDGNGGTDTARLNITVLPEQDNATFAHDDANSGPKGAVQNGNILTNDFDPQDNNMTVSAATIEHMSITFTIGSPTVIPGIGSLTINTDGSYTYVPNATFVGTIPVVYTMCDDGTPMVCDEATLYLTTLDIGTPLPVTMLYFDVYKRENIALLSWATASEHNSKGFDIERSGDGRTWNQVAYLASQSEDGNSRQVLNYTYIDGKPLAGINYYRLKQTDYDGRYEYSVVRHVLFDNATEVTVHPNPAKGYIVINGLHKGELIRLYNDVGSLVKEIKVTDNVEHLSLEGMREGVYYIRISTLDGHIVSHKVVKIN